MQTGDIQLIKNLNERLVLNLIREKSMISGAELANITGMQPSTISNIIKQLAGKNLILNQGKGESTEKGGKRPILWSLNNRVLFAIGLELELDETTAVVLDLEGNRVAEKIYKLKHCEELTELLVQIEECAQDILDVAKVSKDSVLGMGVAVAGVVNSKTGEVMNTDILPSLKIPLLNALEEHFDYPVIVENNANATAIGSKWVGGAVGASNFLTILIKIHKSIGGMGIGMVLNGELYHGASFCSGELNLNLPTLNDKLISLREEISHGPLLRQYQNHLEDVEIQVMIDAAKKGDVIAVKYFNILGHIIGKHIAHPVALLNPEKIILAGDVAELDDLIIKPGEREIEMEILSISFNCLNIVTSVHGHFAVAMGTHR